MMPDLDIVIPAYNEEESLEKLLLDCHKQLKELMISHKFIVVDDGSHDKTWETLITLKRRFPLNLVRLNRNYGQMKALEIGLRQSTAPFVLTMDADMQHPVELIETFWKNRSNEYCIAASQLKREEKFTKAFLSKLFYKIMKNVTGIDIDPNVGDFRLYPREILRLLLAQPDSPKVFRFLISRLGIPQNVIPYTPNRREFGVSKYNFKQMFTLAKDSLIGSTNRLLNISLMLSLTHLVFAMLVGVYMIIILLDHKAIPGWASILGTLLFSTSGIFAVLGINGLYIQKLITISEKRDISDMVAETK